MQAATEILRLKAITPNSNRVAALLPHDRSRTAGFHSIQVAVKRRSSPREIRFPNPFRPANSFYPGPKAKSDVSLRTRLGAKSAEKIIRSSPLKAVSCAESARNAGPFPASLCDLPHSSEKGAAQRNMERLGN
jgi:hypothetical protein